MVFFSTEILCSPYKNEIGYQLSSPITKKHGIIIPIIQLCKPEQQLKVCTRAQLVFGQSDHTYLDYFGGNAPQCYSRTSQ